MEGNPFIIVSKKNVSENFEFDHYKVFYTRKHPNIRYYQFDKDYKYSDVVASSKGSKYIKLSPESIERIRKIIKNKKEYDLQKIKLISNYIDTKGNELESDDGETSTTAMSSFDDDLLAESFSKLISTTFLCDKKCTLKTLGSHMGAKMDMFELLILAKKCMVRSYILGYKDFLWLAWNGTTVSILEANIAEWKYIIGDNEAGMSLKEILDIWTHKGKFLAELEDLFEIEDFEKLLDIPCKERPYDENRISSLINKGFKLPHIFVGSKFYEESIMLIKAGNKTFEEYSKWKKLLMEKNRYSDKYTVLLKALRNDLILTSQSFTQSFKLLNNVGEDRFYREQTSGGSRKWEIFKAPINQTLNGDFD